MIQALLCLLTQVVAGPPVVVATYAYPAFDRTVALAPLAELVARTTERSVRIELFDTPDALSQAVCDGRVDVAMTNLGSYVTMRDCDGVGAVAALDAPAEVLSRYRGVLVARADAGVADLADLPPRMNTLRYSEVMPGSTSGALVQADALSTLGVSPARFGSRRYAGTHDAALDDVLAGRADVAGMAENFWRGLQEKDPVRAASLRLLWRSEPLPPGPVICREADGLVCARIREALLSSHGSQVAVTLAQGWAETEGAANFRAYDEAVYAPFKPM
ncbi:MAG: phosphate/phosphite/phosphonate ABC transporter substrate-binding protein [Alphaproteobacteria bacterium]|jgi:phosphonate transport system substrate-binding protein|nr:MAG: phosphate/phosphite/phosphonate ABC transporter substrate-binding protein [Alphaproteobacteria bacterium]